MRGARASPGNIRAFFSSYRSQQTQRKRILYCFILFVAKFLILSKDLYTNWTEEEEMQSQDRFWYFGRDMVRRYYVLVFPLPSLLYKSNLVLVDWKNCKILCSLSARNFGEQPRYQINDTNCTAVTYRFWRLAFRYRRHICLGHIIRSSAWQHSSSKWYKMPLKYASIFVWTCRVDRSRRGEFIFC